MLVTVSECHFYSVFPQLVPYVYKLRHIFNYLQNFVHPLFDFIELFKLLIVYVL